ncbi:MAG: phosphotransferase [Nocardioidaceae bacterium]|nr:phosphotransferase [Nocardioidaceae bacterium]
MDLSSLTPLAGGWSGETFLAEVAGEHTVVRIYARPNHRGPLAHEVDAALLHLLRGLLPVPEVLEVRPADPAGDVPALLVTSLLPGERGDLVLARLDDTRVATLGRELGHLVADLGGVPEPRPGIFVDADLRLAPFGLADDLPAWVDQHADALGWPGDLVARLREVADRAQRRLDTVDRCCLVHSDLNPKNVLVDPEALTVTGLVDWEFAHAGHPFTDLGNLLRFDRRPPFVAAVLSAYAERRGVPPDDALDLARAADLWALVDLAARAGDNPVATAAHGLLRAIATSADLHAVG